VEYSFPLEFAANPIGGNSRTCKDDAAICLS
jgi:hypothetical protein